MLIESINQTKNRRPSVLTLIGELDGLGDAVDVEERPHGAVHGHAGHDGAGGAPVHASEHLARGRQAEVNPGRNGAEKKRSNSTNFRMFFVFIV